MPSHEAKRLAIYSKASENFDSSNSYMIIDLTRVFEINLAYGPLIERNFGKGVISEIRLTISSELSDEYKLSEITTILGLIIVSQSTIFFLFEVFINLLCSYVYKVFFLLIAQLNTILLPNFFIVKIYTKLFIETIV